MNMLIMLLVAALVGYGFGCFQTGFIVGKVFLKKDIRELGNGNAGASNAVVAFGRGFGLITALVDIGKGIVSILLIRWIFKGSVSEGELLTLLYVNGLFVILGHNFPFYMGFKGGKGTASLIGVLFALDILLGIVALGVLILVVFLSDYIVVGTMGLLGVLSANALLFHRQLIVLLCVLVIVAMSVYKHRKNFVLIKNGEEKHVRAALLKKVKHT